MDFPTTISPEVTAGLLSTEWQSVNDTSSVVPGGGGAGGRAFLHAVKAVYVAGIVGNVAAIVAVRRGERRLRNRKHLLLLTALAVNDLVALVGMLGALVAAEAAPWLRGTRGYCVARVLLRVFGIGSVCIAVTMALERYLALAKPFFYQKRVTYRAVRATLAATWVWSALLTCLPVAGVGVYYDAPTSLCLRYREARSVLDLAYALFYVVFGTSLCVVLVFCNVGVIRALYAVSARGGVVRRLSKSACRPRGPRGNNDAAATLSSAPLPLHNVATAEEVFFSRLMAALSVLFMICWLPQMVTSTLYLSVSESRRARLSPLASLADLLMLLNYVLDPALYVLARRERLTHLCRALRPECCRNQSRKSSRESVKTSCCPQETLLVSDTSLGTELRPLGQPATKPAPSLF